MGALAVVIVDRKAEAAGATGQRLADAPHADNAHTLALQAGAQHRRRAPAGPLARTHQPLALADAPCRGKHQGHRHVGGVLGENPRGIGDCDAALTRGIEVDVIDAGTERSDELQPRASLRQQPAVDAVGHGRHQHIGSFHRLDELGRRKRLVLGVEAGIEQLHQPRLDGVGQLPGDDHQRLFLGTGWHAGSVPGWRGRKTNARLPIPRAACPAVELDRERGRKSRSFKYLSINMTI